MYLYRQFSGLALALVLGTGWADAAPLPPSALTVGEVVQSGDLDATTPVDAVAFLGSDIKAAERRQQSVLLDEETAQIDLRASFRQLIERNATTVSLAYAATDDTEQSMAEVFQFDVPPALQDIVPTIPSSSGDTSPLDEATQVASAYTRSLAESLRDIKDDEDLYQVTLDPIGECTGQKLGGCAGLTPTTISAMAQHELDVRQAARQKQKMDEQQAQSEAIIATQNVTVTALKAANDMQRKLSSKQQNEAEQDGLRVLLAQIGIGVAACVVSFLQFRIQKRHYEHMVRQTRVQEETAKVVDIGVPAPADPAQVLMPTAPSSSREGEPVRNAAE